ncbi:hypothetical protein HanXRQr2_Chr08g0332131 [Helianthus annuus]|uniref:DUF674 domain-containing protein n=2 Tax=Helianthus annuus TaxID=4232 RepID=A0A251U539_HELAN|nr:hypothetical protein HanXRQr2_Chr08g0332131 [Helianthus annuus]KAJ0718698.1 hypothetical protein HanLR1_Chr08g0273451 [Helianthus annuus]
MFYSRKIMPKRKKRGCVSSKTQEVTDQENSSMASPKMSLKLLVDKRGPRVLFAEVPKEFVDFLFHLFSLPLGTLIELIGSNQLVGCLGQLKDSVESFNGNYLQPGIKKYDIFHPKTVFNGDTFLLSYDHASSDDQSGASKAVYRCANATKKCHDQASSKNQPCAYVTRKREYTYFAFESESESESDSDYGYSNNNTCQSNVTLHTNTICPSCSGSMNDPMTVVMPKKELETKEPVKKKNAGYVKEVVTYMVMDDLVVKPMSTISSITLINKFGVKDLSQLEEKTVSFGKDEGLKLLEASLKTKKVLTTIFMH